MKARRISRPLKIFLFAAAGAVGLIALVIAGALIFVDAKAYQPRLEAAVSEALGMEVQVGGRLGFDLYPGLYVTLPEVRLRNRGTEIAFVQQARFGVELLPLLRRQIRVNVVTLKGPRIALERGADGRFNFEKSEKDREKTLPPLALARVFLSDAALIYLDQKSQQGFQAEGCNLNGRRLQLAGGKGADFLRRLTLTAAIACREVRAKDFIVSDLKLSVQGKKGVFDLRPVAMRLFGGQGEGSLSVDFSAAVPNYQARYSLSKFRIEELFKALSPAQIAQGQMDFTANVSMRGKTLEQMKQSLQGELTLRGENLVHQGVDLDKELAQYESSQRFSLMDAGAFFFAGPFGLAVTKGYNFANVLRKSGGSTVIPMLVSDWHIEHGVAQAEDVAMATKANRIALRGKLDFVNEQLEDVTLALIDAQGCAKVRQKIRGSFQQPAVEKPNILKSLAGPALNLLKKGKELLPGGQCEVFYAGTVPPPDKPQAAAAAN